MTIFKLYEWKDDQGNIEFSSEPTTPPTEEPVGQWKRLYSVAIGSVSGAGGSPARKSKAN